LNTPTFVTVIFDRDGHHEGAQQKAFQLHFTDEAPAKIIENGVGVETTFNLKPGTYVVREVVRDSLGGQVSTLNRPIEIPN
jgi:hypothetical protein